MRCLVLLGRMIAIVAATLASIAAVASGATAATNAVWGQGVRAPLPTGASSGSLTAISCAGPGACAAVGTLTDGSGDQQALLLSESSGSWQPQAATLPANAGANPRATLEAVSCASAGDCTAVGSYTDATGTTQGLIVSESAGSWSQAVTAPLPSGAQLGADGAWLQSVSCPTATTCVAVGSYHNASGEPLALLETQGPGGFSAQDIVPSVPVPGSTGSGLYSVACVASGDCVAVGSSTGLGAAAAIVVNLRSGAWRPAVPAPLPTGAATSGSALDSVSCVASGECTAVGSDSYGLVSAPQQQPLVVTEAPDGTLQAVDVPPGSAATAYGNATAISCSANGECAAVGSAGQSESTICCVTVGSGLLLGESSGSWSQLAALMPADAAKPTASNDRAWPLPVLSSVSCVPGGTCSGGGTYEPSGEIAGFWHASAPLLINRSGTAWGSGFAPALPSDAATGPTQTPSGPYGPTDVISAVSCVSAGTCAAVGSYTDAAGVAQPLLVASTPGSAASSLVLQAPSGATTGSPVASSSLAATLSSQAGPTGTISFTVFGPSDAPPTGCSSGGTRAGTATVAGVGSYSPSVGFTPRSAGDYWWYATYSGDGNAQPSASSCGAGMPETVARPPKPTQPSKPKPTTRPPVCSKPTGRLTATGVGPIALGITRKTANRRLPHHTGATTTERFCLTGGGATHVVYGSRRLSAKLPAKARRKLLNRAVLILTASPHYATGTVRVGATRKTAVRVLKLGPAHVAGKTLWYLNRIRGGERVIKVQRAKVTEIGVVNPTLLAAAGWRAVLHGS